MSVRRSSVRAAQASLLTLIFSAAAVTPSGAIAQRMTPTQVAKFALVCASRNKGPKMTTYLNIRCAANHSTNISVIAGVVGSPTEYPAYSSIGFFLDRTTAKITCFAYPVKVGAEPVNITSDCPLWLVPREYKKTNYPSAYAIATMSSTDAGSTPPTLEQVQDVAADAVGSPLVTQGSGTIFRSSITSELTLRISYPSGVGRHWCLWFYQQSDSGDPPETGALISPPGMYGTC
jgi:hypothetical protein